MPGRLGREVLDILRLMIEGDGDGEHYRAGERMDLINTTRWTTLARDLATGELAGLPEAEWFDSQPRTICQRNTIVRPDHRGRSLGRWLKAATLQRVLRERSDATETSTSNADTNAPMLPINHQLGFRPHVAKRTWSADIESLQNR